MRSRLLTTLLAIGALALASIFNSAVAADERPPAQVPAAARPQLMVQLGHPGGVSSIAFSPDGKRILTGSADHTASLWETASGKEIRRFEGHTGDVTSVAFSPDGKQILTGSWDKTARLWDAASGEEIRRFTGHTFKVVSAVFSWDGKHVLTASQDGTARLWDAASGNVIREFPKTVGGLASAAISPDGKQVLVGEVFGTMRLLDVSSGRLVRRITDESGTVESIAFSADGQQVLTASRSLGKKKPQMVRLWDITTGKVIRSFEGHTSAVETASFSPDGKQVLTASDDRTARLWDLATGKEIRRFGHGDNLRAAAFSPDGKSVLTGGLNVWLWDKESGKEIRTLKGEYYMVAAVAFSPDGKQLVTASVDGTRLWDLVGGKEIRRFENKTTHTPQFAVAFSPNGKQVLTGTFTGVRLWDVETGGEIHHLGSIIGLIDSVAFTPDSKQFLAAGGVGSVRRYDIDSGKEIRRFQVPMVNSVALTPDGKQVLTCGEDHATRLWDAGSGEEIRQFKGYKNWASPAALSPDGKQVLVGGVGIAGLFDVASGNEIQRFVGFTGSTRTISFSPNGKHVLTVGFDSSARLWDTASGKEIRRFDSQTAGAQTVAFSPDGKRLVIGSRDCTTRIWDVATGEELCTLVGMPNGDWAVVDSAGRFDASNGGDVSGLHWVVGDEPVELAQLKDRYYDPGLLAKKLGFNPEPMRKVESFLAPKLFPHVALVSPPQRKSHFDIRLNDQGGGIGRVVVKINGKELTADARGARLDPKATALTIPIDLAGDPRLKPGQKNVIEVQAFNAEGYLRSRGLEFDFDDPREAAPAEKPNLWGLVIGVSRYQGGAINLRYAAKDAKDFSTALKIAGTRLFGADKVHLTLLASAEPDAAAKTEAPAKLDEATAPNRANIVAALKALQDPAKVKPSDILVVYMAGHGVTRSGAEEGFYYLTCDAESAELGDPAVRELWSISDQELTTAIARSPALKQVMILDTCHSGRLIEDLTAKRDIPSNEARALERIKDRTGLHILAGCASDSGSYEASRFGQGVLTYSLLLGMQGAALKEDQFVDVSTLFNFAADRVPALARDLGGIQRPVISSPKGSSFEIGEVTADDRKRIPLQRERPLVLRTMFQEDKSLDDVLDLANKVDEQLRGVEVRGTPGGVVFVDARAMPDSYRVVGRYKIEGEKATVSVNMFQDKKLIQQFTVTGKTTAVDDLAARIVAETEKLLASPNPQTPANDPRK